MTLPEVSFVSSTVIDGFTAARTGREIVVASARPAAAPRNDRRVIFLVRLRESGMVSARRRSARSRPPRLKKTGGTWRAIWNCVSLARNNADLWTDLFPLSGDAVACKPQQVRDSIAQGV